MSRCELRYGDPNQSGGDGLCGSARVGKVDNSIAAPPLTQAVHLRNNNMMKDNELRLSSVRISPERISELDGDHVIRSIEKKDIISIMLKYGASSERLTVQIIVGAIFIMSGICVGVISTLKLISDIYLETGVNVGH